MGIRVLLADDHPAVREGVGALLERHGITVIAQAADGREAVALAKKHAPDLAILDVLMPRLNGLDAAREIARVSRATRVILFTMVTDDDRILEALQDGVRAFVMKTQPVEDLLRAIHEVSGGGVYVGSEVSQTVLTAWRATAKDQPRQLLTPRERQVLQLVAEGKSTKQVAAELGIGNKTAGFHRTRVMNKLKVHDTATLVRYAMRHGLISP